MEIRVTPSEYISDASLNQSQIPSYDLTCLDPSLFKSFDPGLKGDEGGGARFGDLLLRWTVIRTSAAAMERLSASSISKPRSTDDLMKLEFFFPSTSPFSGPACSPSNDTG